MQKIMISRTLACAFAAAVLLSSGLQRAHATKAEDECIAKCEAAVDERDRKAPLSSSTRVREYTACRKRCCAKSTDILCGGF
jgi:hypothetical protein